jgi:hypothetical protein
MVETGVERRIENLMKTTKSLCFLAHEAVLE